MAHIISKKIYFADKSEMNGTTAIICALECHRNGQNIVAPLHTTAFMPLAPPPTLLTVLLPSAQHIGLSTSPINSQSNK